MSDLEAVGRFPGSRMTLNGIPVSEGGDNLMVAEALPQPEPEDRHLRLFSSTDPVYGEAVTGQAKRLHGRVYLEKGLISKDDLGPDGSFTDKYSERSTYFVAVNGVKEAAARQISADEAGILSLPTARNFRIDPKLVQEAARIRSLADLSPSEVVEISGLVAQKKDGHKGYGSLDAVISLYSAMLANSLEEGHKLWLLNAEPAYVRQLKSLIGEDQVNIIGDKRRYMGPPTVPIALNPQEIVRSILKSNNEASKMIHDHLEEAFKGISDKNIPADIRKLMSDQGIQAERYPTAARLARDPKLLFQAAVMAYSAGRALPAAMVDQFQGSTAVLWGIDIATAVPYAWGVTEAFTGKSVPRKIAAAAVGAACFIAPYAYFYAKGNEYPVGVNFVVGGFVVGALGKELVGRFLRSKKERRIEGSLASEPVDIS